MTRDRRGFQYALEPVRSLTEWEVNEIARTLASLNAATDEQQQRVNHLTGCFAGARAEAMAQRQDNASLNIQAQRVAHAYMLQVQRQLVAENETLRQMKAERDEVFERFTELRKYADSLDRHKESEAEEYDRAVAKQGYTQADDGWLQRVHWETKRGQD